MKTVSVDASFKKFCCEGDRNTSVAEGAYEVKVFIKVEDLKACLFTPGWE